MVGSFTLAFLLLTAFLSIIALRWKQRLAPFIFGAGVALICAIALELCYGHGAIYSLTGINIYVAIVVGLMLLLVGGLGLITKLILHLVAWFNRRHAHSGIR